MSNKGNGDSRGSHSSSSSATPIPGAISDLQPAMASNITTGQSVTSASSSATSSSTSTTKMGIMKDGMAVCIRCGKAGVKDTFYGKGKQYCSSSCVKNSNTSGYKGVTSATPSGTHYKIFSSPGLPPTAIQNALSSVPIAPNTKLLKITKTNPSNPQSVSNTSFATIQTTGLPGQPQNPQQIQQNQSINSQLNFLVKMSSVAASSNSSSTPPPASYSSALSSQAKPQSVQLFQNQQATVLNQPHVTTATAVTSTPPATPVGQLRQWVNTLPSLLDSPDYQLSQSNGDGGTTAASTVTSKGSKGSQTKTSINHPIHPTYSWHSMFEVDDGLQAAPVSSFKHAVLSRSWDSIVSVGLRVEVLNREEAATEAYWIASVIRIAGYLVKLRYEGFLTGESDFWINIFHESIHPVGWCASRGKSLIPPRRIQELHADWRGFLVKRLTGSRTLPDSFREDAREEIRSCGFHVNMKLEVVDKNRISAVRVATIDQIIAGRMHINYDNAPAEDTGFWCHQASPLIHPIGWAQLVGHELRATQEYARASLTKAMTSNFEKNDATWDLFPSVSTDIKSKHKFEEGMKLEAIDPLNLSAICVATVMKVLRNGYIMVGIDGMMNPNGSDWFCYHQSSPCIFPVGFCRLYKIPLTPPKSHENDFDWFQYIKETKSRPAPVELFQRDIPDHGFRERMMVEAVDLMEPRLVCVATITRVVGRLLRIHFNGWEDAYDQWVDCESPEIFPVGWCELVGFPLEPPHEEGTSLVSTIPALTTPSASTDSSKRRNKGSSGRLKKRKSNIGGNTSDNSRDESGLLRINETVPSTRPPAGATGGRLSYPSIIVPNSSRTRSGGDVEMNDAASSSSEHSLSLSTASSAVAVRPSSEPDATKSLPPDPKYWTLEDVTTYLKMHNCGQYAENFKNKKVDGPRFLKLSLDEVRVMMNGKVGPSIKIHSLIDNFNKAARYRK